MNNAKQQAEGHLLTSTQQSLQQALGQEETETQDNGVGRQNRVSKIPRQKRRGRTPIGTTGWHRQGYLWAQQNQGIL
jgi:hypothetical protein